MGRFTNHGKPWFAAKVKAACKGHGTVGNGERHVCYSPGFCHIAASSSLLLYVKHTHPHTTVSPRTLDSFPAGLFFAVSFIYFSFLFLVSHVLCLGYLCGGTMDRIQIFKINKMTLRGILSHVPKSLSETKNYIQGLFPKL